VVLSVQHLFRTGSRISQNIVGEPLEIGARTIRPVVQLSSWRGTGGDASADGAGVQLRVRPAGVIVLEPEGREHRVPTSDNTRLVLWILAGIALLVAVACEVVARVLR